jgi:hypothetical protein
VVSLPAPISTDTRHPGRGLLERRLRALLRLLGREGEEDADQVLCQLPEADLVGARLHAHDAADHRDVARQTFFDHFPTKQDVLVEISRRGRNFLGEAIESARREGSSTGDRIERYLS